MKKYLIFLSCLVAGTIVFEAFGRPAEDDDERLVKAGVNLVDAGEYRLALQALKDCNALFADALRMEAYDGLNMTKRAVRYGVEYLDALGRGNINDTTISVNSYVTTDVADILDKDWEYAASQILKRLDAQEYNPQLQMMLGILYERNGHYEEAIEQYDRTMRYCMRIGLRADWLYCWKSDCHYGLQDYENAIRAMSQAVDATFGKNYSHLCQRGFYYMQAGKYNEAMADYSKATEVNPDNALAYFGRCAVFYKQGKQAEAKDGYSRGIKIDPAMDCLEYDEELRDMVTEFSEVK